MINFNEDLLVTAIIKQAAVDHGRKEFRNETERFFLGDFFLALTQLDGKTFLRKLNEQEQRKLRHKQESLMEAKTLLEKENEKFLALTKEAQDKKIKNLARKLYFQKEGGM